MIPLMPDHAEDEVKERPMISMDKQYRTRDGRAVRIYAVDGGGALPVHGAIRGADPAYERWFPEEWTHAGFTSNQSKSGCDLVEAKAKITRTFWLVHGSERYGAGVTQMVHYEDHARRLAADNRDRFCAITGPHTVEFTEGDGL